MEAHLKVHVRMEDLGIAPNNRWSEGVVFGHVDGQLEGATMVRRLSRPLHDNSAEATLDERGSNIFGCNWYVLRDLLIV